MKLKTKTVVAAVMFAGSFAQIAKANAKLPEIGVEMKQNIRFPKQMSENSGMEKILKMAECPFESKHELDILSRTGLFSEFKNKPDSFGVKVRRAVADNPATSEKTLEELGGDPNANVRNLAIRNLRIRMEQ